MRVAVEKLPGVTRATVSLEVGLVTIDFASVNEVSIADIRGAIRDQGFSPRSADVRVAGHLEDSPDGPVLRVPGTEGSYPLVAADGLLNRLRQAIGKEEVLLSAAVPRTDDDERATMRVAAIMEP